MGRNSGVMKDNVNGNQNPPAEFLPKAGSSDLSAQLRCLIRGETLTEEATALAFEAMMGGAVHHGEMGALLALLARRTPTCEELVGAARVMRNHVTKIPTTLPTDTILDTAGTGGAPKTWNVSTAAAIIAAASGVVVAKHGNRSRTGRGSAEALHALGINIDAGPKTQAHCLQSVGICFCFAIHHHPATRHVMPVRKALGVPTIFNLLGPLTNPAGAGRQMMGVYDGRFLGVIAEAFVELGTRSAVVLHSQDGLDECSISAPTSIMHVHDGSVERMEITPESVGLNSAPIESVIAHDLCEATAMILGVLDGTITGPPLDMALLNAAVALYASEHCACIKDGVQRAREAIESGQALVKLRALAQASCLNQ
jgi:anthranilate phosphoribosyltransferase